MALQGTLAELPLLDLLEIFSRYYRSGWLSVESTKGQTEIYIDAGRIIYAESEADREPLGKILLGRGLLTQERLDEVLHSQKRSEPSEASYAPGEPSYAPGDPSYAPGKPSNAPANSQG
ncbi:MAG: DUF4388 domain-containing protein, partial [bacterium]|nr:DUF4388 domain-containing protein [bacterium]